MCLRHSICFFHYTLFIPESALKLKTLLRVKETSLSHLDSNQSKY